MSDKTMDRTKVNGTTYLFKDTKARSDLSTTQELLTQEVVDRENAVTGLSGIALTYVSQSTVEALGSALTAVAGQGNYIFNVRASYWSDEPFGGVGINARFSSGYDIQIVFSNSGNDIAYRLVDRSNKTVYQDWASLSGKIADALPDYLKYDVISDSTTYSRTFANVAGVKNLASNLAFSAWDDIPFGGAGINLQYTTNWDLQVIWALETSRIAYRFVNRSTKEIYDNWHIVGGSALNGKKLAIIGDSRSAYSGTLPDGNAAYYPHTGVDLSNQAHMWWQKVIDWFGMTRVVNDSYSGGFVADPQIVDPPTPAAKILSSDTAIANLGTTAPDLIIIYAGVNDWNGSQVQIGEYDGTQTFPTSNTTFREAYAMMLKKIIYKFPEADIWLCTNPYCCPAGTGSTAGNMPVPKAAGNNGTTLKRFNDAIREMAALFGCGVIPFEQCGVNYTNLTYYTGDYTTDNGLHYNKYGHQLLANVAINTLENYYQKIRVYGSY